MSEMEEKDTQQAQTEATPETAAQAIPESPVQETAPESPAAAPAPEAAPEAAPATAAEAAPEAARQTKPQAQPQGRPSGGRPEGKPRQDRPEGRDRQDRRGGPPQRGGNGREGQPSREGQAQPREGQGRDNRGGSERGADRGHDRGPRPDRGGRPDLNPEIDLDKLVADSLYLDNQAHAVVARMRDMDSGTRSQLRRMYSAIRRACRAAEGDRQHQFVMLRARLAYTIARHQLRSLDVLEKLLLQVTRRNEARSYERFRDLFEAIVAYNE
jgi:CRISPR type III-A-associated protein Csm2